MNYNSVDGYKRKNMYLHYLNILSQCCFINLKFSSSWPHSDRFSQFQCQPDRSGWTLLSLVHSAGNATLQWTEQESQNYSTFWQQPTKPKTNTFINMYWKWNSFIDQPQRRITLMTCSFGNKLQSVSVKRLPSRNFLLDTLMFLSSSSWSGAFR